jgi:hypothetical protein
MRVYRHIFLYILSFIGAVNRYPVTSP